jgi:diaminopimelate epimerase
MTRPAESDPSIDWTLTTWEGSRREQLRRWAALPLDRTIAALEEMGGLAEALGAATHRAPAACARPPLARAQPDERPDLSLEHLAPLERAPFWKMSGGGNDFVVFDNRAGWFPRGRPEIVAALCARGTGIGADAVLLLEPAGGGADFRMTYYNADGSEAAMCGNGALCIARLAGELGLARDGGVAFETGAGLYRAELSADEPSRVRLAMRDPRDVRPSLPEIEALGYARAGFANTGTRHLVVLVEELDRVDVATDGPRLRWHPLFQPAGANVSFAAVRGPGELALRTYEKGVEAETLSCGTGATAAAILTHLWGLTEPPVIVHPPGGFDLTVRFRPRESAPGSFGDVTLEGDAQIVFEGRLRAGDPA